MNRPSKKLYTVVLWVLGMSAGAALAWYHTPLRSLQRQNPDEVFLFANVSCAYSRLAMKHVEAQDLSVLVLPLSYQDEKWADGVCRGTLARLSGIPGILWNRLLPTRFACGRLIAEARGWHSMNVEGGAIPAWAIDGSLQGVGVQDEVLAQLGIPAVPSDMKP